MALQQKSSDWGKGALLLDFFAPVGWTDHFLKVIQIAGVRVVWRVHYSLINSLHILSRQRFPFSI